jgi:HlyD family secretion protein
VALLPLRQRPRLPYYSVPLERGDLTPMMSAPGMIHAGTKSRCAQDDGTVRRRCPRRWCRARRAADRRARRRAVDRAGQAQATLAQDQGALVAAQAQLETRARLDRYENVWRRSPTAFLPNEMDGARAEMMRASSPSRRAGLAPRRQEAGPRPADAAIVARR